MLIDEIGEGKDHLRAQSWGNLHDQTSGVGLLGTKTRRRDLEALA